MIVTKSLNEKKEKSVKAKSFSNLITVLIVSSSPFPNPPTFFSPENWNLYQRCIIVFVKKSEKNANWV